MSDQLWQRILGELEQLVLIDPHTHINPHAAASTTLADILGYHYYTELAHASGMDRERIEQGEDRTGARLGGSARRWTQASPP